MNTLVVLSAILAVAFAAPNGYVRVSNVPILRFDHDITGAMSDSYSFESGNGIHQADNTRVVASSGSYVDEYGKLIRSGPAVAKNGNFHYTSPEGIPISLSWVADEGGFRATGAHLPVPPVDVNHAKLGTGTGGYGAPAAFIRSPAVVLRSAY